MNLVIKEGNASVKNFIFSSWIKCYLGTVEADLMGKPEATRFMHDFITKKFDEGVTVSYLGDDETDEVYSYVVFDPKKKTILFAYTKSIYRKDGFLNRLVEHNNLTEHNFCFVFYGATTRYLAQKYKLTYKPLGR
jgi:hypothetical protein